MKYQPLQNWKKSEGTFIIMQKIFILRFKLFMLNLIAVNYLCMWDFRSIQ